MDVKISVIIPTFNRKDIISNSINSILEQNINGIEIIVVDDKSTDGTIEYLKNKYNNQLKYLYLNENGGCNIARNKGANIASGEWLLFLDSDDTLTAGSLNHLIGLTEVVKCDIIFSACINSQGLVTSNNPNFEGYLTYQEYICEKIIGEYLPMSKRETFLKCYFDESTRRAPGIGHARVAKLGNGVYITNFIARNYDTEILDSITNSKKRNYKAMSQVWKIILKEQGIDKLKSCPINFFKSFLKYCYYSFFSLVKN